jgi:hypothetical protein
VTQPGSWIDILDSNVTFHLDRRSKIIISYKITVTCDKPYSPGGDFLPSRQSDAIGVRLSVDGQPHRQSGSHANPFSSYESSSSELEGYIILDLSAGDHIAKLQWKKWGSFVFSWTSNPTLVGGFSAARTIEVSSQHKYLWSVQPLNFAHISQNKTWEDMVATTVAFQLPQKWILRIVYSAVIRPDRPPSDPRMARAASFISYLLLRLLSSSLT